MSAESSLSDFKGSLTNAARDNPLAAVLIGGGALWMLMGSRAIGVLGSSIAASAKTGAKPMKAAAEMASDAGEALRDTGRKVTDRMGDRISENIAALKDTTETAAGRAAHAVRAAPELMPAFRGGSSDIQSALTELFRRQPLALGIVGLAIGAGLATAAASSKIENDWVGRSSDAIKEEARTRVSEASRAVSKGLKGS